MFQVSPETHAETWNTYDLKSGKNCGDKSPPPSLTEGCLGAISKITDKMTNINVELTVFGIDEMNTGSRNVVKVQFQLL